MAEPQKATIGPWGCCCFDCAQGHIPTSMGKPAMFCVAFAAEQSDGFYCHKTYLLCCLTSSEGSWSQIQPIDTEPSSFNSIPSLPHNFLATRSLQRQTFSRNRLFFVVLVLTWCHAAILSHSTSLTSTQLSIFWSRDLPSAIFRDSILQKRPKHFGKSLALRKSLQKLLASLERKYQAQCPT